MIKFQKLGFTALSAVTILSIVSCNGGYKKLHNGLEYKFVEHGKGTELPKPGSIGELRVITKVGDTVLSNTDTRNNGQPVQLPLNEHVKEGDISEGFALLKEGDHMILRQSIDSIEISTGVTIPDDVKKKGKFIEWDVKLERVLPAPKGSNVPQANTNQAKVDNDLITDYLKKNNLTLATGTPTKADLTKAYKTDNGIYYIVMKKGTGALVKSGQIATMNYTGMLLDGKKFDSNEDPEFKHVQPFQFSAGSGQVIKGWDQMITQMHIGDRYKVIIPSQLAYGERAMGDKIQANSVLIFEMEAVSAQ